MPPGGTVALQGALPPSIDLLPLLLLSPQQLHLKLWHSINSELCHYSDQSSWPLCTL